MVFCKENLFFFQVNWDNMLLKMIVVSTHLHTLTSPYIHIPKAILWCLYFSESKLEILIQKKKTFLDLWFFFLCEEIDYNCVKIKLCSV